MTQEFVEASHVYFKELARDLEAFVRDNPGTIVADASSKQHLLVAWMAHAPRESRLFSIYVGNIRNKSKIDLYNANSELIKSRTGRAELAERWAEGQHLDFGTRTDDR